MANLALDGLLYECTRCKWTNGSNHREPETGLGTHHRTPVLRAHCFEGASEAGDVSAVLLVKI